MLRDVSSLKGIGFPDARFHDDEIKALSPSGFRRFQSRALQRQCKNLPARLCMKDKETDVRLIILARYGLAPSVPNRREVVIINM